jgi:YggT family protein
MLNGLLSIIHVASTLFIYLIIIQVILTYILPPYHKVRLFFDRIVTPFLFPIQQRLPLFYNLDFSPLILILIIRLMEIVLAGVIRLIF